TIHQAILTFHVDESKSRHGTLGPVKVVVGYIGSGATLRLDSFLTSTISAVIPIYRAAQDSVSFTDKFTITTIAPTISAWLRNSRGFSGGVGNYGLIIALDRGTQQNDRETSSIDHFTMFGPDAPDSLRPTMSILYSLQKEVSNR